MATPRDDSEGTFLAGKRGLAYAGGCLSLFLLLLVEVAVAASAGFIVVVMGEAGKAVPGGEPSGSIIVLAALVGALAWWLTDRLAKRLTGISPFRLLWEFLVALPPIP